MAGDRVLRLIAAGDVMLGDSSHFLGRGVAARIRRHGPQYPWAEVAELIGVGDVFLANLESPLSAIAGGNSWERVYRGTPDAAAGLRRAKRSIVTLANNHILEHGSWVLAETKAILESQGVAWAGYDSAGGPGDAVLEWRQDGLECSLIAESLIPDITGRTISADSVEHRLIEHLRSTSAEIRIVSLHWGDEYSAHPSAGQRRLGRLLVEAGATLVIGHHPHVLQPIESVGDGLVAYSLGNFVFDQDWTRQTRCGGLLDVTLGATGVKEWRFVPTVSDARCQPRPATDGVAAWAAARIAASGPLSNDEYFRQLTAARRHHRISMKTELLRHLPRVGTDTWRFLATKRRRPRPHLDAQVGPEGRA